MIEQSSGKIEKDKTELEKGQEAVDTAASSLVDDIIERPDQFALSEVPIAESGLPTGEWVVSAVHKRFRGVTQGQEHHIEVKRIVSTDPERSVDPNKRFTTYNLVVRLSNGDGCTVVADHTKQGRAVEYVDSTAKNVMAVTDDIRGLDEVLTVIELLREDISIES